MPRLFLAIDLPETHKARLVDLRRADLPARWTPPEQYHLTLRFLGEVETPRAAAVEEAMALLSFTPFSLHVAGLGVFPSLRKPRVLFAHIEGLPQLTTLHQHITRSIETLGFPAEPKPFQPHVTIARFKNAAPRIVRSFLRTHGTFTLDPFPVHRFHLYESHLRPEGALHTVRASFG